MRLLILAPSLRNTSPGSRFRVEQWMEHWERDGVECVYRSFEDEQLHNVIYTRGNRAQKAMQIALAFGRRFGLLGSVRDFDAVFIYEEASRIGPAIIERLIARTGVPIIYDFCDPVYLAYKSPTNSYLSYLKFFGKTATICELAAKVLVGNDELGDYARQHSQDVHLVPITIDTDQYQPRSWPKTPPARPIVGWSGSHTTAPHLAGLADVLRRLKSARDFELEVIGAPSFSLPGVDLKPIPWRAATETADLSRFDLGIMPLPDDEWTRLRSHLKIRQYMGLGIPCVVSPVGVNKELISDGENGFLAVSDDEWVEKVSRLIDDPALRQRLGEAGRRTIEERYSAKLWAPRVLEMIRVAIAGRHRKAA